MTPVPLTTQHESLSNAAIGKGSSKPTEVIEDGYNGYAFGIGDDAVVTVEPKHDIDFSKDIGIHLVWYVDEDYSTNSGEVQWQADWVATSFEDSEAIDAPGSSGTEVSGDINIPASAKTLVHTTNLVIDGGEMEEKDVLGITISRIALNDGSNPTAEPVLLSVHLEYTPLNH